MLAVPDAGEAARWYAEALGATELWTLGSVVGLSIGGAPFFLGEPAANRWQTPAEVYQQQLSSTAQAGVATTP